MKVNNIVSLKNWLANWIIRQPKDIVGIDVGTGQIKAAEISLHNGKKVLKATGLQDLPENVIKDGHVINTEILIESVQRLLLTNGISSRDVVVSVTGRSIFVREVTFPAMSNEELSEAIKWEMEKHVPFEPDSYYYDFAVIGQGKSELELRVLLVAAPRDLINNLIDVFAAANCNLIAIDIEVLAVYRTLPDAQNALIIDVGAEVSQVSIFQGTSPVIKRFIPIGGNKFTEVIMQTLELEYGEAEQLKQRQAGLLKRYDFEGELPLLHKRLQLLVEELGREVRRTVEYYQVQNREAVIEKIYLIGGGSKLDNLLQHLAVQLGDVRVLRHDPFDTVTPVLSLDKEYLQRLSPQLAVAIGLALRGGSYDKS